MRAPGYHLIRCSSLLFLATIVSPAIAQQPVFESRSEREAYLQARREDIQVRDRSLKGLRVAIEQLAEQAIEPTVERDALGRPLRSADHTRTIAMLRAQRLSELGPVDQVHTGEPMAASQRVARPYSDPFIVNSARDSADAAIDGSCDTGQNLPNGDPECTLRAAIQEANEVPGTDPVQINFNILTTPDGFGDGYDRPTDTWTILPNVRPTIYGRLPLIERPNIHIHGETQPGVSGFPHAACGQLTDGTEHTLKIRVDGTLVTKTATIEGLIEFAPTAVAGSFRGLAVGNAVDRGIRTEADFVTVECSYVGTDLAGSTAAGNFVAVDVSGTQGSAVRNSVLSGSGYSGIEIAANGIEVMVEGNLIGTNAAGSSAIANVVGIEIFGSDNRVGWTGSDLWNLISGNSSDGIIVASFTTGTIIENNRIGTNLNGSGAVPNGGHGVRDYGTQTRIGGTEPGAGNVVSGNSSSGLALYGESPYVEGNLVGTNLAGTGAIPNQDNGIFVGGDNIRVGGTSLASRNVISGNTDDGIELAGTGNSVEGNLVGLDINGTTALPNGWGIHVNAADNTIGGPEPEARNVISGNSSSGVLVQFIHPSTDVSGTVIQNNYIGTNEAGTAAVPNGDHGVHDFNTDDQWLRFTRVLNNLISGNDEHGVVVEYTSTRVAGNIIGLDESGSLAIPNAGSGVHVYGDDALIGMLGVGGPNFIASNGGLVADAAEVFIESTADRTRVRNNYLGTDVSGMIPMWVRISVADRGTDTEIGVASPEEGNLIAASVWTFETNAVVAYNWIGINANGDASLGYPGAGIVDQADGTQIFSNVISGHGLSGIAVEPTSTDCSISQNFVGTDATGTLPVPNLEYGVFDEGGIGTWIGQHNRIAFNQMGGVRISSSSSATPIINNHIYANGGLGIDLVGGSEGFYGETYNDAGDPDTGPNFLQNYPVMMGAVNAGAMTTFWLSLNSTANALFRIEVFASLVEDASGYGEGRDRVWYGDILTDGVGNALLPPTQVSASELPIGAVVTATATRLGPAPTYSPEYTSEFSEGMIVEGPHVVYQGRLFLEGPFTGGSMATGPHFKEALPLTQPYSSPRFDLTLMDYDGSEAVSGHSGSVVDWIVLSLRETILASSEVGRTVALLLENGQIIALDGSTQVRFNGVTEGSYYVVACHRNHVCAMSDLPVLFGPLGSFDFTTGAAYSVARPAMKHFGGSDYGLFAGDANADGDIQALDANRYFDSAAAGLGGYDQADFSMDGLVQPLDFDTFIANTAAGASSQVP